MYKAVEIANYFINKGKELARPVDNMKLQKLIYIAHGYSLAFDRGELINEKVQAWDYGPVVESVYHVFKRYGNYPIENFYFEGTEPMGIMPFINLADKNTIELLEAVWNTYGQSDSIQLANLTHERDTPWEITVRDYITKNEKLPKGVVIDNELIKKHYKDKIKQVNGNL